MAGEVVFGAHQSNSEAGQLLATFWPRVTSEVRSKPLLVTKTGSKKDEPIQELPLARIKKIMKQDGDVKMISAEAPILFSKAAEIFISELSLRAWIHTEDNKRRTLQRNDIAMAITKYDQFDFLIDIVPRDELKPVKRQEEVVRQSQNVMGSDQVQYYFQLSNLQDQQQPPQQQQQPPQQQQQTNTAPPTQQPAATQVTALPAGAQIIQQPNGQILIAAQPHQIAQLTGLTAGGGQSSQIVHLQNAEEPTNTTNTGPSEGATTPQTPALLQTTNGSTQQVQFASGQQQQQQIQYIRVPQGLIPPTAATGNSGTNLSQVIGISQQQQQQQQSDSTNGNENESRNTSTNYSQMYPSNATSGVSNGTVYVVAEPETTDNGQSQN